MCAINVAIILDLYEEIWRRVYQESNLMKGLSRFDLHFSAVRNKGRRPIVIITGVIDVNVLSRRLQSR